MKTVVLISGGLDSILAARLIKEQGIEIIPLNFKIPFCHRYKQNSHRGNDLSCRIKDNLDLELTTVDISDEFLRLFERPKHGFGSNMNPCIDCKILMLRKVKEIMEQMDAKFIVTGEVLGQRPMSQHKQALQLIEKRANLEGLVLRPLSAKLLSETIPEKEGWVDRKRLLDFSGRTRRPQMDLANRFNIKDYPNPAGGCLLTDPQFSKRLKELIDHNELSLDNIELLKIGRHFRLAPNTKLVVGRDEREDKQLEESVGENDYLFIPPQELAGSTSLGRGTFNEELIRLSCGITSRYCDLNCRVSTDIVYKKFSEEKEKILNVSPIKDEELIKLRI